MLDWSEKNVLVTGGCSFLGSHLVGGLVERGARVGFYEGLDRTIEWYYNNHNVQIVSDELQQRLMRR